MKKGPKGSLEVENIVSSKDERTDDLPDLIGTL
jgi:hypothetical protein